MKISIFWFRRDLRLNDNAGLYHALHSGTPVLPVFIYDANILDDQPIDDKRVAFIYATILELQKQLEKKGSTLYVLHGNPLDCFKKLIEEYAINAVFTNTDYEPYATIRDKDIADYLKQKGISFHSYKDQVIFEKSEIVKDNKEPYHVFTPYSKRWKEKLNDFYRKPYDNANYSENFLKQKTKHIASLSELGFKETNSKIPAPSIKEVVIKDYDKTRDIPGIKGTTRLGLHLRFGTLSIRKLVSEAVSLNDTFLNELIWREFYQMILWHYPHTVTGAFKKVYDDIKWRNNEKEFELWRKGETGYPIVDAGMRELNETGFMHNRVRMIVASFLTKHLLIDWRWGEAYFAEKLLDYDMAANIGNWQWAAGSGCDAAPYFRIFNPYTQTEKFDPDLTYIKKWVPELDTLSYPAPIVDHKQARERCLAIYKAALNQKK